MKEQVFGGKKVVKSSHLAYVTKSLWEHFCSRRDLSVSPLAQLEHSARSLAGSSNSGLFKINLYCCPSPHPQWKTLWEFLSRYSNPQITLVTGSTISDHLR